MAVHNAMAAMGLAQTGAIQRGELEPRQAGRTVVELEAGRCYTFVALGSRGVDDLELSVVDEAGVELARDTTVDSQAATQVCPDQDGPYQVLVTMAEGAGRYLLSSWSGTAGGASPSDGRVASGGNPGTCAAPLELRMGRPVQGDTRGGSAQLQGSCVRGQAPEQVYRIEVPARVQLSATLQSEFDGGLYLLADCDRQSSEVACNDDAERGERTRSRIDVPSLDAGTYFLVVDGYGSEAGEFELIVSLSELRPIGEVCEDATSLRPGQPTNGSTEGAPDYFQATCAGNASAPDRVYHLDVQSRSRLRVRSETDYDGALHVRSACEDPNSEVACNDDYKDQRHSVVTAVVDPGRYFVFADGYGSQGQTNAGNFTMTADIGLDVGSGVAGDTCSDALSLPTAAPAKLDTFDARDDLRGSCGGQGGADVVYRLAVRHRSRLRARVDDAEFSGALYLQSQCGDMASEVACVETAAAIRNSGRPPGQPGGHPGLETVLAPGTYFVVVDGEDANQFGAGTLRVELDDLVALERACRTAPMLRDGQRARGDTGGLDDDFHASCAGGAESGDMLYRLRVRRRSRVDLKLSSEYDGALHLRNDCLSSSSEIACNDDDQNNRSSRIETTLDAGIYYVIVDGFQSSNTGTFELDVRIDPL